MRRPLIAGNWKMNLNRADAVALASGLVAAQKDSECDVLVCPSTVYLDAVSKAIAGSDISLGAQDVNFEEKGAFTGAAADRKGLLKSADGGVLFLDEIGELGIDEQAMLLRAIEEIGVITNIETFGFSNQSESTSTTWVAVRLPIQ